MDWLPAEHRLLWGLEASTSMNKLLCGGTVLYAGKTPNMSNELPHYVLLTLTCSSPPSPVDTVTPTSFVFTVRSNQSVRWVCLIMPQFKVKKWARITCSIIVFHYASAPRIICIFCHNLKSKHIPVYIGRNIKVILQARPIELFPFLCETRWNTQYWWSKQLEANVLLILSSIIHLTASYKRCIFTVNLSYIQREILDSASLLLFVSFDSYLLYSALLDCQTRADNV